MIDAYYRFHYSSYNNKTADFSGYNTNRFDRKSQHFTVASNDPLIATELSSLNRIQLTAPA